MMTNEEMRKTHEDTCNQMIEKDRATIKAVSDLSDGMDLPNIAETFKNKINELYDILEKDKVPIGAHLSLVQIQGYLYLMYLQAVRSLAQYSLALVRAGTSGDLETLNKVKATKGSIEELYAKVNEIINRFDFVKDLPLAIDIEKGYPTGWDKQKVLDTCMGEFKKLGLLEKQEEGPPPPSAP